MAIMVWPNMLKKSHMGCHILYGVPLMLGAKKNAMKLAALSEGV
jgi:hypothetical protein